MATPRLLEALAASGSETGHPSIHKHLPPLQMSLWRRNAALWLHNFPFIPPIIISLLASSAWLSLILFVFVFILVACFFVPCWFGVSSTWFVVSTILLLYFHAQYVCLMHVLFALSFAYCVPLPVHILHSLLSRRDHWMSRFATQDFRAWKFFHFSFLTVYLYHALGYYTHSISMPYIRTHDSTSTSRLSMLVHSYIYGVWRLLETIPLTSQVE